MSQPSYPSRLRVILLCLAFAHCAAPAQTVDVAATVVIHRPAEKSVANTSANVVVWLTPLDNSVVPVPQPAQHHFTLVQKDKMFHPHLLVVPVGSSVDFPNLDPFFHNVFSLFNGKRFDLGLYEGHSHRAVRFDREGVSYIFCNIHPDMGAVIVSLNTPYYAVSTADGVIRLKDVPQGRYRVHLWAENVGLQSLSAMSREVQIDSQDNQLGTFNLQGSAEITAHHKNKFGEDYAPVPKDPY